MAETMFQSPMINHELARLRTEESLRSIEEWKILPVQRERRRFAAIVDFIRRKHNAPVLEVPVVRDQPVRQPAR